uniref:Vomeronasal type-1 receptor n=1 Tax=Bos indicus x Bos taurus TaxID=30522 RepID=A0A4W2GP87_BOBOX
MSFHRDALRTISQAALKTTYLTQIGVGSLANVILLFHNISPVLLGHNQRPPHTILSHMALSNLLFLLSSGVPYTMAAFVLRKPLSGSLACLTGLSSHM